MPADPKRTIAIIPARGGSQRIPRKNIRSFNGRPILEWSVRAAHASGQFDEIMVSTEDPDIAKIAEACGAKVPFLRSVKNADHHATTVHVLCEVLAQYCDAGRSFDLACCLYPTAAFVRAEDLSNGRAALEAGGFDVFMPVAEFDNSIWRSLRRGLDGTISMNFPDNCDVRTQDLEKAYHDAGQWYWFVVPKLNPKSNLMRLNAGSVLLPNTRVQDIDNEEDWAIAEGKHRDEFGEMGG